MSDDKLENSQLLTRTIKAKDEQTAQYMVDLFVLAKAAPPDDDDELPKLGYAHALKQYHRLDTFLRSDSYMPLATTIRIAHRMMHYLTVTARWEHDRKN